MRPDGLTICPSGFGPKETMDRLAVAVAGRGMTVFARIDHAAGAASVGMALQPMELLIFGNPRAGTLLMQTVPTLGIALPLKALVWGDETSRTWLAYDDPRWLARRHGANVDATEAVLVAMVGMLNTVAKEATGRGSEEI